MKSLFVFLFLVLGLTGYWHYQSLVKEPEQKLSKNQIITTPSRFPANQNNKCALCFFVPPNFDVSKSEVCSGDFQEIACNSKASEEQKLSDEDLKNKVRDLFDDNYDRVAQQMGYENINQALKAELKKNGIRINPTASNRDLESFKNIAVRGDPRDPRSYGNMSMDFSPEDLFSDVYNCRNLSTQIRSSSTYGAPSMKAAESMNTQDLQAESKRLKEIYSRHHESSQKNRIRHYAKNIPTYMQQLEIKCQFEKSYYPMPACEHLPDFKKKFIELYRQEEAPDYEQKAQNFIKKIEQSLSPPAFKTNPNMSKDRALQAEISYYNYNNQEDCNNNNAAILFAANKVSVQFLDKVRRSKTNVERTLRAIYNPRTRKIFDKEFLNLKADVQALVPQITENKEKQNKINGQLELMSYTWHTPPSEKNYQQEGDFKIPTLKDSGSNDFSDSSDLVIIFSDPSASYFTENNAFYTQDVIRGQQKTSQEGITFLPFSILQMQTNPYGAAQAMAHEMGHKLGPQVSQENGHDLNAELNELLACFKDSSSIRMTDKQKDETVADYIAAEVMASQISQLPRAQRQNAALASVQRFCKNSGFDNKLSHPDNILRINGIFSANANLRKAIGCKNPSKNYKACGIKDVSLLQNTATGHLRPQEEHNEQGVH